MRCTKYEADLTIPIMTKNYKGKTNEPIRPVLSTRAALARVLFGANSVRRAWSFGSPPSRRAISCRDITLVDTDKIKLSPLAVEVSISLLLLFLAHPRTMTQPLEEIGSPATSGTRSAPLFPTVYTFDSRSYGAAYNKNFTLAIFHVSFCCFLFDSI